MTVVEAFVFLVEEAYGNNAPSSYDAVNKAVTVLQEALKITDAELEAEIKKPK